MDLYYVNNESREAGQHQVHKLGCEHFPLTYIYLGPFSTCQEALDKARQYFPRVDVCPSCCALRSKKVFFDRG
jgi:hypothetical protein